MARTPLLTDYWRDVIAIGSAIVTLVGFLLTVLSLAYAIWQIWKTKSAAEAAKSAADRALADSLQSYHRYVLSISIRLLSEARIHTDNTEWEKSSTRLNDLADLMAQLAPLDQEWSQLTNEARKWANTLRKIVIDEASFSKAKWERFVIRLQEKLDRTHGPFIAVGAGGTT